MFRATEQCKILVIDDNEVVLEVTRAALEGAGHRVLTHDRAAGCVALVLQEKPDLVLMDVNMPHLGGDIIVSVLSKIRPARDTVVLLYSSISADILRAKADAVGAHGYLQKTGDQFTLVREVNYWLRRSAATSSARMRIAKDVGLSSISGRMRAVLDLGAPADDGRPPTGLTGPEGDGVRSSGAGRVGESILSLESGVRSAAAAASRARTPIVLLMGHDMGALSSYGRYLQTDPFSVEYAISSNTALRRLLSDDPPDVAVCDVMPDLSGMDVYRRALSAAVSWRRRVVLIRDVETADSGGYFRDFKGQLLIKPVTAEVLRNAVWGCMGHSSISRAGRVLAT